MIEIEKPRIETEELSNNGTYGRFVVEPLERGFGTTLGNGLRRVLLSSLPGVAVKSIKIDGVVHEFSTIPGVKEDVTEIVLNIKGLTAKLHCDGPKTVEICAEECGDVMGTFVGHDHNNDYAIMYKNILLAYGRYTGGNTVYNDLPNGCRVIVLKENERRFDSYIRLANGKIEYQITYPDSFNKQ